MKIFSLIGILMSQGIALLAILNGCRLIYTYSFFGVVADISKIKLLTMSVVGAFIFSFASMAMENFRARQLLLAQLKKEDD